MKTFWSNITIQRTAAKKGMRECDWVQERRVFFEKKTGVKWSVCSGGDGIQFHPVDDFIEAIDIDVVKYAVICKIREAYLGLAIAGDYVSYLQVSEKSGLDLKDLMGVIKGMEKKGLAHRTVDRMGKGYAFKMRQ